jgi:hypothetical protein
MYGMLHSIVVQTMGHLLKKKREIRHYKQIVPGREKMPIMLILFFILLMTIKDFILFLALIRIANDRYDLVVFKSKDLVRKHISKNTGQTLLLTSL